MPDDYSDLELLTEDELLEDEDLEAYFELDEDGELTDGELLNFGNEEADFQAVRAGSTSYALLRAIPDRADYQRFIPLNYRLNAKQIVGKLAQDLPELKTPSTSDTGKFVMDAIKFARGGSGAPLINILKMVLMNIPAGYLGAAAKIAADEAASGFSRGVVLGADGRSKSYMLNMFGRRFFPRNNAFEYGRTVAIANYVGGLLAGYVQGRSLSERQRKIFWLELKHRMGNQSFRGPPSQWKLKQWGSWYVDVAAAFRRYHL